jgi:hypothetical protein
MEHLTPLIAKLWSVLNARAQALSNAWKGFVNFPDFLPRKVHARLVRELARMESLLRRKILHDAHKLKPTLTPTPPKVPRTKTKTQRSICNGEVSETEKPFRTAPFRFDDISAGGNQCLNARRTPSNDHIMAMRAQAQKPRAEMLDTARLHRRLESFYIALQETDLLARKLAQRLADNDPPRLKPFKPGKIFKPWTQLFETIDWSLASYDFPECDLDSS